MQTRLNPSLRQTMTQHGVKMGKKERKLAKAVEKAVNVIYE
jgi:hypothetical protein